MNVLILDLGQTMEDLVHPGDTREQATNVVLRGRGETLEAAISSVWCRTLLFTRRCDAKILEMCDSIPTTLDDFASRLEQMGYCDHSIGHYTMVEEWTYN